MSEQSISQPLNARETLAARYAQLNLRAQETPPQPPHHVLIAGHVCGWITQAATDAIRHLPYVSAEPRGLHIAPDARPGPALDAMLAEIAATLREADCLRGWRNETLEVSTGSTLIGQIERAAARPLGLRTRAVHLNAWTPDGRLWVARRAMSKSTDPGMWDTLVGGLVSAGESLDYALTRECAEEAGLSSEAIAHRSPLRTILRMHRRLPEGYQVEDLLVSHCILASDVEPRNCDGEVSEIATVSAREAVAMVDAGAFTLEAALVVLEDLMRANVDLSV